MNIHLLAAARPNFMKIAPLYHFLKMESWANPIIVHTGQHYDINMSHVFFQDLRLPKPHIHLGVGSGTHAEQTGNVMIAYEKILLRDKPDLVIVPGDVNPTMAATIAAVKLGIKTAHLEAGLRSFDRTMPEEINRIVTDNLADILWTPSSDGDENLIKEGVDPDKIDRVGNIMIDSLEMLRDKVETQDTYLTFDLKPKQYTMVTLHRPSNVDTKNSLESICNTLVDLSKTSPILFPVHPRTRERLERFALMETVQKAPNIIIIEPQGYLPFMNLVFNCKMVITDSGGLQEETTYLGIPCLTLRPNTERPVTITHGSNTLCTVDNLKNKFMDKFSTNTPSYNPPEFWDGRTAERIAQSIKKRC